MRQGCTLVLYKTISQCLQKVFFAVCIFQKKFPQTKLVRVIKGIVYDVAVDLRMSSSTYGKYHGELLTADNKKQYLIPSGFAHDSLCFLMKLSSATNVMIFIMQAMKVGLLGII